ncbi:MAG: hypothetical protein V7K89_18420 [Nostoc sp.]|uniref:hypothetical protein n=1 Tax=Nostoc sp. TaxID=1180 RepID=UPI002FF82590
MRNTTSPYWSDRNFMQTFSDVANRLNNFGLAYLFIINGTVLQTTYLCDRFTGGSLIAPCSIECQQLF